jgi:hypothetical protein
VEYHVRGKDDDWRTALLEDGETLTVQCRNDRADPDLPGLYDDVAVP